MVTTALENRAAPEPDDDQTRKRPFSMMALPSTATVACEASTSTCEGQSQSAPVSKPYGFPNAICTPGNFSSWRKFPTIRERPTLVPIANSPVRLELGCWAMYSQLSAANCSYAVSPDTSRPPLP